MPWIKYKRGEHCRVKTQGEAYDRHPLEDVAPLVTRCKFYVHYLWRSKRPARFMTCWALFMMFAAAREFEARPHVELILL